MSDFTFLWSHCLDNLQTKDKNSFTELVVFMPLNDVLYNNFNLNNLPGCPTFCTVLKGMADQTFVTWEKRILMCYRKTMDKSILVFHDKVKR